MPIETPQLHVIDHPLMAHLLTEARERRTSAQRFRHLLKQIGVLIAWEATRDLPVEPVQVETALETCQGARLVGPVTMVPILRAGLGLVEGMLDLIPHARMGHIGIYREEQTCEPHVYLEKLPPNVAAGRVLLVDPMLATGGSAAAAVKSLLRHGCQERQVRLLCLLGAPTGVQRLIREHPGVHIYAAGIDRELDSRGYILPGLGDAGDRLFGTED